MSSLFECDDCGYRTFYTKMHCPDCGSDAFQTRDPGQGTIRSLTDVHVTPSGVREPNTLGLATFPEGTNLIAQIEGDLDIGDVVTVAGTHRLREGDDSDYTGPRLVGMNECESVDPDS